MSAYASPALLACLTHPPFPLCLSFRDSLPSELRLFVSSLSPPCRLDFFSLPSLRFRLSRSRSPGSCIELSAVLWLAELFECRWVVPVVPVEFELTLGAPFLDWAEKRTGSCRRGSNSCRSPG